MYKNTLISLAVLGSVALAAVPAFAQTNAAATAGVHAAVKLGHGPMTGMKPGVFGTVTAVNGNSITVTSANRIGMGWGRKPGTSPSPTPTATPAPTVYTIDATNAKVMKANATSSVSAIAVGDMIMVQGTVTGTNVAATNIRDMGVAGAPKPMPTPVIQGNGQPIIAGKISAINGSTLTITNQSNVTYTIDASNAKVEKSGAVSTLSSVTVGDSVVVQGTVNGTSVVAYSVIDSAKPVNGTNPQPGFIRGIGQFFEHLFGF